MKNRVRMSDIAKILKVSNVTVSKALGDKEGVSEELRLRIKQLADEMGYAYKRPAPQRAESYTVGVLVAEHFLKPNRSFYWNLYQHLVEALKVEDYYSILEIINPLDEKECHTPKFIEQRRVDGVMVLGHVAAPYLAMLAETNTPLVLLDASHPGLSGTSIAVDNINSTMRITEHLFEKGHTRIGFVGSLQATDNIKDRYLGYYKALINHGLAVREDWIIPDRIDLDFLTEFELPGEMPSAFVCNCDQTAYHFMRYLTKQGCRIPEDVSVVGFYNYIYATLCSPKLTTMCVDLDVMSNLAVDAQLRLIQNGQSEPESIVIYAKLVERDSVKNLLQVQK